MPVKHVFSCTKVRWNKLHSFSNTSADVFSLLYFKVRLHSQFLNFLIEEVLLGWRGCKLFWFMEAGSRRSLGFRPIVIVLEWSGPGFWRRYPPVPREISSYTHLCSVRPWCMWSCWNSLHVVQSVVCLHVVRMVESHICTNRLRVHLERVHPLMNLSNYFRCRRTFAWLGCQM